MSLQQSAMAAGGLSIDAIPAIGAIPAMGAIPAIGAIA